MMPCVCSEAVDASGKTGAGLHHRGVVSSVSRDRPNVRSSQASTCAGEDADPLATGLPCCSKTRDATLNHFAQARNWASRSLGRVPFAPSRSSSAVLLISQSMIVAPCIIVNRKAIRSAWYPGVVHASAAQLFPLVKLPVDVAIVAFRFAGPRTATPRSSGSPARQSP